MRRSSLRFWLLFVSALFALLVVGGVALTTYVVISESMTIVAYDAAARSARNVADIAKIRSTDVVLEAAAAGFEGEARDREATRLFFRAVPVIFRTGAAGEAEVAFYDEELLPLWYSDERAFVDADAARVRAVAAGQPTESVIVRRSALAGLFGSARLDVYTIHAPIDLPDGTRGVLDVTYFPVIEESVIDIIRLPMIAVAISAALVMVLMIQAGMSWVLKLVKDLRVAAESVESGRFDVRLPVEGNHEIADLARTLNLLIGRLRHRAAIQARFVADASHELATPVAGIRGYTNILRAWGATDADVRDEAITAIDRESRRMARLCGDLLSLVKSEQATESKAIPFDVGEVAREVMASAITRYMEKGLNHEGPPDVELAIVGDPERLEDVLSVLVDNAFKYTPSGGTVSLDCRATDSFVTIEVSDTGIGISAEDLPNVFERFYRSDASRSKETGGFGLGLAIAKAAVEAMGGDITVRSAEGQGTAFTVLVPRSP